MAIKKKLGRGLSALIGGSKIDDDLLLSPKKLAEIKQNLVDLSINEIIPNPEQPRVIFDKIKLEELAASIKFVGLIEPIIVMKIAGQNNGVGKYSLIAGERRWRASKIAGFSTIPAIIKNNTNNNLLETMLIENIQREDLSPIEEATSFESILKQKNITHEELAKKLGKSRSHLTNSIRLLRLPAFIKEAINNQKISMGHAKVLHNLTEKEQKHIVSKIINDGLSVRDVENLVNKKPTQNSKKSKSKSTKKDPHFAAVEEKIRDILKTKVSIKPIKNKVGKIEIEYYDYDDLNRMIKKFKR